MEKTAQNTATEVCLSVAEQPSHMGLGLCLSGSPLFILQRNKQGAPVLAKPLFLFRNADSCV
ncbi:hypothetical protein ACRRTK_003627 [Alexandromys fortis]